MLAVLASLFTEPIQVTGLLRMVLVVPLALSIAIVYKTTKLEDLKDLLPTTLALWVTIVAGMYAVGVGLWGVFNLLS